MPRPTRASHAAPLPTMPLPCHRPSLGVCGAGGGSIIVNRSGNASGTASGGGSGVVGGSDAAGVGGAAGGAGAAADGAGGAGDGEAGPDGTLMVTKGGSYVIGRKYVGECSDPPAGWLIRISTPRPSLPTCLLSTVWALPHTRHPRHSHTRTVQAPGSRVRPSSAPTTSWSSSATTSRPAPPTPSSG
jgi:hypothetical protein